MKITTKSGQIVNLTLVAEGENVIVATQLSKGSNSKTYARSKPSGGEWSKWKSTNTSASVEGLSDLQISQL